MEKDSKSILINSWLIFYTTFIFALILILLAGFRPPGFDPDYHNYLKTLTLDMKDFDFFKLEPFYWVLVYLNQLLFNAKAICFFLIFATVFVSASMYAIVRYSANIFLSSVLFLFLIFPDFGLIQIRNGIAITIFWLAIHDLINNRTKSFIIKCVIATLFHYSLIVSFIFILLSKKKINKTFYIFLPLISIFLGKYLFTFENFKIVIPFLPSFLQFKAKAYVSLMNSGVENSLTKVNLINLKSLTFILFYYFSILVAPKGRNITSWIMYVKVLGVGIAAWFMFYNVPVFSFRFSNTLFTIVVFLLPIVFQKFQKHSKIICIQIIVLWIALLSYNIFIKHEIFNFGVF